MSPLTLVIGNKNYSSRSLRPWLVLRQAGIAFEEVRIPLYVPGSEIELAKWSSSGKVPALREWVADTQAEAGRIKKFDFHE